MSKSRRGRGEGAVWNRKGKDGKTIIAWYAQVSMGFDSEGKRIRRTIKSDTKAGVLDELSRLRTRQVEGTLPEPSKITVAQFLDDWMQKSGDASVSGSTGASYRRNIRYHISKHLGHVHLQKLSQGDVQKMLSLMRTRHDKPASARLKTYIVAILSRALDQAVAQGYVIRNVCGLVERPRVPKFEIHPFTLEQARAFLKATRKHPLYPAFMFALDTGVRLGELLVLKWSDIDLKLKHASIRRTLSIIDKRVEIKEPKTKTGRRKITLSDACVNVLTSHRKAQVKAGHAGVDWVFCDASGKHLMHQAIRKPFLRAVNDAGLPRVRFHDLRHTSASLLLLAGTHPKIVQERLGHTNIAITLDVYSHALPSLQADAAEQMNRLLG